jgi:hypothetical protein
MTPRFRARRLLLVLALTLPPVAGIAGGVSPAPAALGLASIAAITVALVWLESWLRELGFSLVSVPTTILVLYGTGLVWHEAVEPGPPAIAFLAGMALVRLWSAREVADLVTAVARGAALGPALAAVAFFAEAAAGGHTIALARPLLLDSLFSSRHGLLFWTPVFTIGLLGLLGRARRRVDAAGALTALALMAVLNASLRPWWGGGFGNARFLPALPLAALGLAAALDQARAVAVRQPLRIAAAAGALLVGWNLLLMTQYRAERIPRDDTVSFPAVAENSAREVTATLGAPSAWPANWIFSVRHGLPAARYDLLGGQDVLAAGPAQIDVGQAETDAALLGDGWSVRHPCGASVCREVEGRARLFLPLADPRGAVVQVRAQGSGRLQLTLNGGGLAAAELGPAFAEVGAAVGRDRLRRGPNELELTVSDGGLALVDAVRVLPIEAPR